MDEIQQQLNDSTIVIGDFPTIIENNFEKINNNDQIIYNYVKDVGEIELYQQSITNGRIFKFESFLFNQACRSFENSELEFQKFISFCNYYSVVGCLYNTNLLVVNSFYLNHLNQFRSILATHYQDGYQLNVFNNEILMYNTCSIRRGDGFGHNSCIIRNGISIDHLIKYEDHFICPIDGVIEIDQLNGKLGFDYVGGCRFSNQFNLVLYELFLRKFKNTNTELPNFLRVTKSLIDNAINFSCVGFLKYYYENGDGTIDNGDENGFRALQQYLKERLLSNYNLKYLNWLNK